MTTADELNMNTIAQAEVAGLTKAQNPIQIVVLIAVSIITVWTLYMVPSWQAPGDPFLLAAVVGAVTAPRKARAKPRDVLRLSLAFG